MSGSLPVSGILHCHKLPQVYLTYNKLPKVYLGCGTHTAQGVDQSKSIKRKTAQLWYLQTENPGWQVSIAKEKFFAHLENFWPLGPTGSRGLTGPTGPQ